MYALSENVLCKTCGMLHTTLTYYEAYWGESVRSDFAFF